MSYLNNFNNWSSSVNSDALLDLEEVKQKTQNQIADNTPTRFTAFSGTVSGSDPVNPSDFVNKQYLETQGFVKIDGTSTMTGDLKTTDVETTSYFSVNDQLAKIDNITSATQAPDITNFSGKITATDLAITNIYDKATETTYLNFDGSDISATAVDLLLNGDSVVTETKSQNLTDKTLTNPILSGFAEFIDTAAPDHAGANKGRLYKKTGDDGLFWKPDSGGAEVDLTDTSGGAPSFPLLAPNGTVSAPSYSFANNPDTGFYYNSPVGEDQISVSINGVERLEIKDDFTFVRNRLSATDGINVNTPTELSAATISNYSDAVDSFVLNLEVPTSGTNTSFLRFYQNNFGTQTEKFRIDRNGIIVSPSLKSGDNAGLGTEVLASNSGTQNTALGYRALKSNTTGSYNVGVGTNALLNNLGGSSNVAIGQNALLANTSASGNIGIGTAAGSTLTTGVNNTAIGNLTGFSTGAITNSTCIGNGAAVTTSNTIRLGNGAVSSLLCQVGLTELSDQRLKENIVECKECLNMLSSIKSYKYNFRGHNPENKHIGLLAQEVQVTIPDVVKESGISVKDALIDQKVENPEEDTNSTLGINYSELIPMLIGAINELRTRVESLESNP